MPLPSLATRRVHVPPGVRRAAFSSEYSSKRDAVAAAISHQENGRPRKVASQVGRAIVRHGAKLRSSRGPREGGFAADPLPGGSEFSLRRRPAENLTVEPPLLRRESAVLIISAHL